MSLYNLENRIRDARPSLAIHCFVTAVLWSILHLSYTSESIVGLGYQILMKFPPPTLLAGSALALNRNPCSGWYYSISCVRMHIEPVKNSWINFLKYLNRSFQKYYFKKTCRIAECVTDQLNTSIKLRSKPQSAKENIFSTVGKNQKTGENIAKPCSTYSEIDRQKEGHGSERTTVTTEKPKHIIVKMDSATLKQVRNQWCYLFHMWS